ncbi:hypothetical protein [Streptomyces sp. NPDC127039]|uniref:hypothetical protein n=1 Tax=Streptomyces sp. NPDC127039 TaxID=3347115 RepID=UPI0036549160
MTVGEYVQRRAGVDKRGSELLSPRTAPGYLPVAAPPRWANATSASPTTLSLSSTPKTCPTSPPPPPPRHSHAAHEQWAGIEVRHDEPAVHLDLWLATMNNGLSFGRFSIGSSARALGPADPAL